MMVARLQKLCDTDCEKLALNYVKSCLKCIPATEEYKEVQQNMYDMYLALLLCFDKVQECVVEVNYCYY